MTGDFPHMRHWSFVTYTEEGVPRDGIHDIDIEPDAGSSNPFRAGVRRDVEPRRFTIAIVNGPPPNPRAPTVYTLAEPGLPIGMHMRNYVPDRSIDWTGGVGVPKVELHLADGKVLEQGAFRSPGLSGARHPPHQVAAADWQSGGLCDRSRSEPSAVLESHLDRRVVQLV